MHWVVEGRDTIDATLSAVPIVPDRAICAMSINSAVVALLMTQSL